MKNPDFFVKNVKIFRKFSKIWIFFYEKINYLPNSRAEIFIFCISSSSFFTVLFFSSKSLFYIKSPFVAFCSNDKCFLL